MMNQEAAPTDSLTPAQVPVRGWRYLGLIAIKTVHTIAFFSIGSCLVYLVWSGLAKRSDRRAAIAGAVVTGETLVYALNRFRCPLTSLAIRLGAEHASVADIYLPRWLVTHLPLITGPMFSGAVMLHIRNLVESGRGASRRSWSRPRARRRSAPGRPTL